MKKILILFSAIGLFSLTGCNNDDDVAVVPANQVVENEVFQVGPVNFAYDSSINMYSLIYDLNPQILPADMILVYRRTVDPGANNAPVWQLIPRTIHNGADEIDYDFNFDQGTILFTVDANYDLQETPTYINNQIFRVVILPGYDSSARFDYSNYDAVVKKFNIKESDIKVLK